MQPVADRTLYGRYRYLVGGAEVPVAESYVVDLGDDGTRVRSRREAPEAHVVIDVDAWFPAAHHPDPAVTGEPAKATVTMVVGDHRASTTLTPRPSVGQVQFPLLRVFAGAMVLAAAQPGGVEAMVPDIRTPQVPESLLEPLVDRRTATPLGESTVSVELERVPLEIVATRYHFTGGSYAEAGAEFEVDDAGLLLRYRWAQPGVGDWEVALVDARGGLPRPLDWFRPAT